MTGETPFAAPAIQAQPDAATTYAEAFRVGRDLAQPGPPPPPAAPPRQNAGMADFALGDVSHMAAQIDATPPAQRAGVVAQAQQTNEQLTHVLIGLKGYPPDQRLAVAQHLAQTTGLVTPGGIGPGDITDQGIDAHLAQAMAVEQFLKREELYASIPPSDSTAAAFGMPAVGSAEARPDPRTMPTGAGHLTNAQLSATLGL